MEQIISAHVLSVTVIATDGWAGYDNVSFVNNGVYQHEVIIHAEHFVNDINPEINTQAIEGTVDAVKMQIAISERHKPCIVLKLFGCFSVVL